MKFYTNADKGISGTLALSSLTVIQLRRITGQSQLFPDIVPGPWNNSYPNVQVDDETVALDYEPVASTTLHVDDTGALVPDAPIRVQDPVPGYYYCVYYSDTLQCTAIVPTHYIVFATDGSHPLELFT